MAMTVTAAQGGSTGPGMLLRVYVITGAKTVSAQTGGAASNGLTSNSNTWTLSVTTTAGSNVYGADAPSPSPTPTYSNASGVDDYTGISGMALITWKALNVTGGATARGFTCGGAAGALCAQEILAAATLAEDLSAPAVATSATLTSLQSGSFTPPAGSLLVAVVATDGGTGQTTCSVTDDSAGGPLNWTQKAFNNTAGCDYAGVWIADVPAGATSGPDYAGSAADLGGGTGSWTGTSSATGAGDDTYATWAVP